MDRGVVFVWAAAPGFVFHFFVFDRFCRGFHGCGGLRRRGLEFAELIKDVNAAPDATSVTADFNFTNKSNKPVTIAKADPTCSCIKVQISEGKQTYAPGETGVIRTSFEVGNFSGTVDKVVALYIDNDKPDHPSMQITTRVHIPVIVDVEPKTLKWELGAKAEPKTIQIRMAEGTPIHVTDVKSSSDAFSCELKTLEDGKKYDLIVTPKTTDAPSISVIRLETDCEIVRYRVQQAFAVIPRPTPAATVAKP